MKLIAIIRKGKDRNFAIPSRQKSGKNRLEIYFYISQPFIPSKSRNFWSFLYFWREKIRDEREICRDKRGIETFQKTVMDELRDKRNRDKRGLPVLGHCLIPQKCNFWSLKMFGLLLCVDKVVVRTLWSKIWAKK